MPSGQASKKQKVETSADVTGKANTKSPNANISTQSLQADMVADKMLTSDNFTSQISRTISAAELPDSPKLKQTVRSLATSATSFSANRYKLDNRPTMFRISAPLPFDLANVSITSSTPSNEENLYL